MKQNTHLFAQVAISPARGGSSSTPRSAPRRSSGSVSAAPSRSTVSASVSSPAWKPKSIASRSRWPLIARTRSPRARPARAAAVRGRTRVDARAEHIDEERTDDEDHVAADHDGRDPEREHLEIGQRHEGRREQELVGHRVEERAQAALASLPAGDPAVEQIREGGGREDDERRSRLPVHEERDEDRDQEDAEDREPVGKPHGRALSLASRSTLRAGR